MALTTADEVYEQIVKPLPESEQLRLLERIQAQLRSHVPTVRRKVSEFKGIAKHPLCGEDAQAWISRSRREDDENSRS